VKTSSAKPFTGCLRPQPHSPVRDKTRGRGGCCRVVGQLQEYGDRVLLFEGWMRPAKWPELTHCHIVPSQDTSALGPSTLGPLTGRPGGGGGGEGYRDKFQCLQLWCGLDAG
jgi:hypothetical protein